MRFPLVEQLDLPCTFEGFVPGRLHPDGRRYLPLILFRLAAPGAPAGVAAPVTNVTTLGVVDRHHVVDQALEGRAGIARLVFLLSSVRLQEPPLRQGLLDEQSDAGGTSIAPVAYGRVVAVPTWEQSQAPLPYESLYTELVLDVGLGMIGVRTNATAADLSESLGKARVEVGDWLRVWRSRIDVLAFEAQL
jgi:hypothetical protein